jgi:DNA repair protein RadA/Sms
VEEARQSAKGNKGGRGDRGSIKLGSSLIKLSAVGHEAFSRISTEFPEVDQVLGGGLVPGQVVLLAGEPGIGKSTLLLQVADRVGGVSRGDREDKGSMGGILYVAGEESPSQIASRAKRLGVAPEKITVLPETEVSGVVGEVRGYRLVIVDSIQTMWTSELNSSAGSVAQVRECAARLTRAAKEASVPLIIVGHVNKDGEIAGPKVLEHIVDTVLSFEGDPQHFHRILRTTKNRFGAVYEIGVFEMGVRGLKEVKNPSDLFLSERLVGQPGSVVTVTLEGARPMLVEIQALTQKTAFGYPRRTASGFNLNRLHLLLAVLERHAGVKTSDKDVYINVAAGFITSEPAADLAVCAAVASSVTGTVINAKTVVFGEVGLAGEIRAVSQNTRRANEARKMGFTKVVGSGDCRSVKQALGLLFGSFK